MRYIRTFSELGINDVPMVGGKNASLGEMFRHLSAAGVRVPDGFATTAEAYRHYLAHNHLTERIQVRLKDVDSDNLAQLEKAGADIRRWILEAGMPPDLAGEITTAYENLARQYGPEPDVAVRSSATAEDLPTASFAGQQDTFLNIRGAKDLLDTCRRVYASLYNDRAISYRVHQGFAHEQVALSIGVQKMVRSDLASSGVMFTLDTETGFRDVVFINASYGLGENVVQGTVNPDEFHVFKTTLATGKRPILKRHLGGKAIKMVYAQEAAVGVATRNIAVPEAERQRFSLTDDEVLELARYGVKIEQHYSKLAGHDRPMDIEWAKDGVDGKLYILQARPETVRSREARDVYEVYALESRGKVLVSGKSVGRRITAGVAHVIEQAADMAQLRAGEVLVTDMTDPDWEPVMKTAAGIVTNRGGRTCHAAIVARELGIPAIVGCGDATEVIGTGVKVTVSCAEGDTGRVYEGEQKFRIDRIAPDSTHRPRTKIMINVGNPDQAFENSFLPNDGVGLARLEFIINHSIQAHPRALLEYDKLGQDEQRHIDRLTAGYADRRAYFISRLAEGIGTIAAAFHPKPVIVRLSDFKSNEYASLFGGAGFEPREENPMLGLRGASRYYSESFRDSFAMECAALKQVREDMGLDNVVVMIPFVRSVDEAKNVLAVMRAHGLERGKAGLKVYLMCEIPANALLAEDFLRHLDGFSIGSNDLTQLTLGVDRDSGLVTGFDERNPAVLKLMETAIHAARKMGKYAGICGQAPSDYPEITTWLVRQGIESISFNPDSVIPMTRVVQQAEQALK
ncbi:MAG: phosphoenolpyruvate synthase [Candidatus Muproteobacteria bacterium RIFCSPHIGHO2_12_FULL_60_33]|uniref:Phosphoenolpyruvate synthase n=1 Tax=Candidatus Muproteobacteria bacterium RIFCSPLOWO2_01_FULL_60_18 TaxID=1817768 RepID=A0A1F6U0T2_9PROT|nr:MAG: phosphoenolpyruvate synthase [Candidatus Muproteobacteria bacterium RIFCSPLOWO2_01_FULL_60_18]OGI53338.1 MAG: phosphoenolpyruvate synthase [Candidatus Muproteobacteria bacterium RIFCSPHIGHO2_01_60_12]OGI54322.1 MAG: phosphoenolpyruvate synthase [Candidatus Muproteobacteria bacterium RIFCSPHIGHO2_02_FULL_60_13]OGI54889.1 MAG: phosphoenolpyruvate synthase [Candidatus Muproteobacteria bacterium RIFCSPHIGHO2_12_FULL_60_33]OGI58834.1 MAG: phosphoenolpyruvate synthase [Candidatus Muproteobact